MAILFGFLPLLVLAGLVAAIVAGFRSSQRGEGQEAQPIDAAEAAKSLAIHVGLFLALIASAWGLIDVLQSFVEGDRIAGTNPDVARGLSLLIVGTPVFLLLLRAVEGRYRERAEHGDTAPHRGWSVYLVVALTTTLIASLVSVAQITYRITDEFNEFRPEELMQLLVWASLWAAHWFVLRPHYRVRGDVHLALGTIIGLGWFVSGVGAVVYRVLDEAYQAAFDDSLIGDYDLRLWIVVGLAGAGVWAWHWLLQFNAEGSVEGDRRRSPLWFFTVIVAGVLPGLIAMLVSATTMVSGVLIWFIGSTDESAADFFEPASILLTVLALGFITWAYHRWELERGGPPERNDALRFHDYVVLATGLVAVVGAAAVVVGQFFDAVSADSRIAGSFDIGNTLIVAITVLVGGAMVWWAQWSKVERHRADQPVEESDSIWRKLYLITAFGVGGVVLGVSATWTLFLLLRDLLDSQTSHDTLGDLADPVGWGVAVFGAVWYHLGVWRADRAVLGTKTPPSAGRSPLAPPERPTATPPPPPPPPLGVPVTVQPAATAVLTPVRGIVVRAAVPTDAGELFTLRRAVAAEEALRARSLDVPELRGTLAEVEAQIAAGATTVAVDGSRIVGAFTAGYGAQPSVAPDRQGEGIEALLLANT